jgi:hypothetical protein
VLKLPSNIPLLYATKKVDADHKTIHARLFALGCNATWLIAEYDPKKKLAYGYCDLYGQGREGGAEWGYVSIEELESLKFMGIPRVEVDAHFTPKPFKDCVRPDGRI